MSRPTQEASGILASEKEDWVSHLVAVIPSKVINCAEDLEWVLSQVKGKVAAIPALMTAEQNSDFEKFCAAVVGNVNLLITIRSA